MIVVSVRSWHGAGVSHRLLLLLLLVGSPGVSIPHL